MGPKRKKSKPNPEDESRQPAASAAVQVQGLGNDTTASTVSPTQQNNTVPKSPSVNGRTSWYAPSWRAKASPTATIARESISVAQGATSESSGSARPPNSVSKSLRGSRKSIPITAEPTRVHATSDASGKSRSQDEAKSEKKATTRTEAPEIVMEDAVLPPEPGSRKADAEPAKPAVGGTWLSWWSRPDGYGSDTEQKAKRPRLDVEEASQNPLPGISPVQSADDTVQPMEGIIKNARDFEGVEGSSAQTNTSSTPYTTFQQPAPRSWFGLWSSVQNQPTTPATDSSKDNAQGAAPEFVVSPDSSAGEVSVKATESEDSSSDSKTRVVEDGPKASAWAFWSSNKTQDPGPTPGGTQKQVGELAVADTPSQNNPEAAQFNEQKNENRPASVKSAPQRAGSLLRPGKRSAKANSSKSVTNDSANADKPISQQASGASSAPTTTPVPSETPTPSQTPPPQPQPMEASSILTRIPDTSKQPSQQTRANLILPTFDSTFPLPPNPGYIERLSTYLAQAMHLPGAQSIPEPIHVYKTTSLPKIKKAVALGIHGFFPGALIQKFIGQPRGTSVRLSNYAATAIKIWYAEHQGDGKDAIEIEKVALEGEGTIADRVSTLWKLLLNWLSHLRQADFILVACHSQGVPVAVMLVAKLIQLGALSSNVRLGVCAMAGINLGPFLEYRSRLFGGVALELFDFCDTSSRVSRVYAESLELCLRHGVRVTFVGSIDDQLVSLESALNVPVSHPYINRAVFVDGQLHAPNFLTHLVVFAIKLRNLGVSDHGLLRQLSAPLAGSLVGGDGHSRVYDEPNVYKLAMDFALRSSDIIPSALQNLPPTPTNKKDRRASSTLPTAPALAEHLRRSSLTASLCPPPQQVGLAPIVVEYEPPPTSANANPFVLPWAVRGVLEEDLVKREMKGEVEELVNEFEAWKPTSKVLRDVRWRLEGVRGMT